MVPMGSSRAVWPPQGRAEPQQVLLSPEENDTRFPISLPAFLSKKHAFHVLSLTSGGTSTLGTSVWTLVSSMKHVTRSGRCPHPAIWTSPTFICCSRFSICDEPSSEKQRDTREALLFRK